MSHYHRFCLAFSDLSGEVYTSSGSIVLSLTNGTGCDRTVLTLSPMQTIEGATQYREGAPHGGCCLRKDRGRSDT